MTTQRFAANASNRPCVDAQINPQHAARLAGRQKRPVEHVEDYPHVVAVLDAKTRVIECADGIQWVLQRRTGSLKTPWAGRSFCRTKEALIRIAGSHPALEALPDRFFPTILLRRDAARRLGLRAIDGDLADLRAAESVHPSPTITPQDETLPSTPGEEVQA